MSRVTALTDVLLSSASGLLVLFLIIQHQIYPADTSMMQDLAVKTTGKFVLRYRVANMFWGIGQNRRPIVAECWSRPFEVYGANLFPGLKASTELTKVNRSAMIEYT